MACGAILGVILLTVGATGTAHANDISDFIDNIGNFANDPLKVAKGSSEFRQALRETIAGLRILHDDFQADIGGHIAEVKRIISEFQDAIDAQRQKLIKDLNSLREAVINDLRALLADVECIIRGGAKVLESAIRNSGGVLVAKQRYRVNLPLGPRDPKTGDMQRIRHVFHFSPGDSRMQFFIELERVYIANLQFADDQAPLSSIVAVYEKLSEEAESLRCADKGNASATFYLGKRLHYNALIELHRSMTGGRYE